MSKEVYIARACWITFWINGSIAAFEIVNGLLGYSALLIIDGLTFAAIAVVATTALLGIHMSEESATGKPYHYSQGKVQYLVALVVGIVLGVAGITYWGVSIKRIGYQTMVSSPGIGTAVVLIAMMASVLVLFFLRGVRREFRISNLRRVERLQELGLLASMMVFQSQFSLAYGWYVGDRLARFSISLIVTTMSFLIIKDSLNGLMDGSSGEEIESEIESLVKTVEQVKEVRWVRTRRVGSKIHTEMKVEMDREQKASEFDQVTKKIKEILVANMEEPVRVINVEYCVTD